MSTAFYHFILPFKVPKQTSTSHGYRNLKALIFSWQVFDFFLKKLFKKFIIKIIF